MKKCFVVIPFKDHFDTYYNKIIKPALSDLDIEAIRGDEIYSNKPIINDIIEQIITSDYIIADVSNKSPNVNYELGLAHALCKQVIILSQNSEDIPFDYRHIRAIIYKTDEVKWAESLSNNIKKTIKNIDEGGYKLSSIDSLNDFYKNIFTDKFFGLQNIFTTRQAMNMFLTPCWDKKLTQLDIVAFGLKSFRDSKSQAIYQQLQNGLNIRILSPNPLSKFLQAREKEEKLIEGSIKKTIQDLQDWSIKMNNNKSLAKNIILKFYDSTPLDFYWRQDDNLFIGPYLYGIGSQQTITFHFKVDSIVGGFYTKYFEEIWNNTKFTSQIIN
jgi:hypothetical protein